ncbi:MAG: hypothetical protein FWE17_02035 [Alphaproteobacteria bacterium]|nr:hypothetical protein [Alphaproteobacteria bacterium]MCL2758578.1 hypothetical protein [Alphaproteobacteria bacterium]
MQRIFNFTTYINGKPAGETSVTVGCVLRPGYKVRHKCLVEIELEKAFPNLIKINECQREDNDFVIDEDGRVAQETDENGGPVKSMEVDYIFQARKSYSELAGGVDSIIDVCNSCANRGKVKE